MSRSHLPRLAQSSVDRQYFSPMNRDRTRPELEHGRPLRARHDMTGGTSEEDYDQDCRVGP